jgi:hypothetical protein
MDVQSPHTAGIRTGLRERKGHAMYHGLHYGQDVIVLIMTDSWKCKNKFVSFFFFTQLNVTPQRRVLQAE